MKINQNDLKAFLEERTSDKGILLMGNTGVGKTYSMENFYLPNRRKGHQLSAYDLYQKAVTVGPTFINEYLIHDLFIDDFGSEPKSASYFGTVFCPLEMLIHERYKLYPQYKTNFSTNLNMKEDGEILIKYGPRIFSRIKEMCDLVIVEGNDLRTQ